MYILLLEVFKVRYIVRVDVKLRAPSDRKTFEFFTDCVRLQATKDEIESRINRKFGPWRVESYSYQREAWRDYVRTH